VLHDHHRSDSGAARNLCPEASRTVVREVPARNGEVDLATDERPVELERGGCLAGDDREMGPHGPDVASGHRAGEGSADAEIAGVPECLLDEAAVDRHRPSLVEAGDAAELRDRVEERDDPAGRE
jgi:hypothetical protein